MYVRGILKGYVANHHGAATQRLKQGIGTNNGIIRIVSRPPGRSLAVNFPKTAYFNILVFVCIDKAGWAASTGIAAIGQHLQFRTTVDLEVDVIGQIQWPG